MASYYVSPYGSDANNGLGPDASHASNKPWLTIGKALGASGIASGDTVYLAPGRYIESVTVAMTSATAETSVLGDPVNAQGFKTGAGVTIAAGPVVWTAATNDLAFLSNAELVLAGRDYLTFDRIQFVGGAAANLGLVDATTTTSTNIVFRRCYFENGGVTEPLMTVTVGAGVAASWLIDACRFSGPPPRNSTAGVITVTLNRHSADYDAQIVVQNCLFVGGLQAVAVQSTGAGVGFGGGVDLVNVSQVNGIAALRTLDANLSTTFPCTINNSKVDAGGTVLQASVAGQVTEDYNIIRPGSSPRSNVTAGVHSLASFAARSAFDIGGDLFAGFRGRAIAPLSVPLVMGFGSATSPGGNSVPTTDIDGLPRPCGAMTFGASGTATAGASKTLTDSGVAWGTNQWVAWMVKITGGTGSGQVKQIASNTGTVLTVDGNWQTTPSTDSTYVIYRGAQATSGKATAGAASTLTDSNAAWGTNQWAGFTIEIRSGTGSGQTRTIASNTATVQTVSSAWGVTPDSTSQYWIYRGTNENTVNAACGAFERGNTMTRSTVQARTGSYSLRALGPAVQDFDIPVSAAATTVTVYVQWDSTYAGTKPSMSVLNGEECGVTAATATATGSAGSWEQLTLTFTPTAAGIVTIRLQSSCTSTLGSAYFDDLATTPAVTPTLGDYMRAGEPLAAVGGVSLMPFAQIFGG